MLTMSSVATAYTFSPSSSLFVKNSVKDGVLSRSRLARGLSSMSSRVTNPIAIAEAALIAPPKWRKQNHLLVFSHIRFVFAHVVTIDRYGSITKIGRE